MATKLTLVEHCLFLQFVAITQDHGTPKSENKRQNLFTRSLRRIAKSQTNVHDNQPDVVTHYDSPKASPKKEADSLLSRRSPNRRSSFFQAINSSRLPPLSPSSKCKSLPLNCSIASSHCSLSQQESSPDVPLQQTNKPAKLSLEQLFQQWVEVNTSCLWDPELVVAMRSMRLVGSLKQGWLIVTSNVASLTRIQHAHAHSLLHAPRGYRITNLGELSGMHITPVVRTQFTPLSSALCWVLHCRGGKDVTLPQIQDGLQCHFPLMLSPDDTTVHSTLSELIRQRKVYNAGTGYSLVTEQTYLPTCEVIPSQMTISINSSSNPVLQVTRSVQTDLADLLTQDRPVSLTDRRASMRVSKTLVSKMPSFTHYRGTDLTDVTVKYERGGSVLNKILRVTDPRICSFNSQFPPPEWKRTQCGHSVSTQTSNWQVVPDYLPFVGHSWTPRSSTLPRRLIRPLSSSSLSQNGGTLQHFSPLQNSTHLISQDQNKITITINPSVASQSVSTTNGDPIYANPYHLNSSNIATPGNTSLVVGLPPRPISCSRNETHKRAQSASPRRFVQMNHQMQRQPNVVNNVHSSLVNSNQQNSNNSNIVNQSIIVNNGQSNNGNNSKPSSVNNSPGKCRQSRSTSRENISNQENKQETERIYINNSELIVNLPDNSVEDNININKDGNNVSNSNSSETEICNEKDESYVQNLKNEDSKQIEFDEKQDQTKTEQEKPRPEELSSSVDSGILPDQKSFTRKVSDVNRGSNSSSSHRRKETKSRSGLRLDLMSKNTIRNTKSGLPRSAKAASDQINVTKANPREEIKKKTPPVTSRKVKKDTTLSPSKRKTLKPKPESEKKVTKVQSPSSKEKNVTEGGEEKVPADTNSVRTYPSLSELNFSSLAAQKILRGVSVNSIDTLLEVNQQAAKEGTPVTNTNFGYL